jgi:hypothetical protein
MKPSIALKIASVISLLFAAGHTVGGSSSWSPRGETPTLQAMRAFHMEVAGVSRSYYDFYMGFGYSLSVFMALEAVLLWQLAGLAKRDVGAARPLVAAFFVAALSGAVITWIFIFPVPGLFATVQAACLGLALYASRSAGREA